MTAPIKRFNRKLVKLAKDGYRVPLDQCTQFAIEQLEDILCRKITKPEGILRAQREITDILAHVCYRLGHTITHGNNGANLETKAELRNVVQRELTDLVFAYLAAMDRDLEGSRAVFDIRVKPIVRKAIDLLRNY